MQDVYLWSMTLIGPVHSINRQASTQELPLLMMDSRPRRLVSGSMAYGRDKLREKYQEFSVLLVQTLSGDFGRTPLQVKSYFSHDQPKLDCFKITFEKIFTPSLASFATEITEGDSILTRGSITCHFLEFFFKVARSTLQMQNISFH